MAEDNGVTAFRLTPAVAEKRIHDLAQKTADIILSLHAKERMSERDISIADIYAVLRRGMIVGSPTLSERGDWKCKMTLQLRGRRTVGVITALIKNGKLLVLTVEWEDEL